MYGGHTHVGFATHFVRPISPFLSPPSHTLSHTRTLSLTLSPVTALQPQPVVLCIHGWQPPSPAPLMCPPLSTLCPPTPPFNSPSRMQPAIAILEPHNLNDWITMLINLAVAEPEGGEVAVEGSAAPSAGPTPVLGPMPSPALPALPQRAEAPTPLGAPSSSPSSSSRKRT